VCVGVCVCVCVCVIENRVAEYVGVGWQFARESD